MLLSSDLLKSAEVRRLKQILGEWGRGACGVDFNRDVEDSRTL